MSFLRLQLYLKTWGVETIYLENIIGIIKTYGFKVNKTTSGYALRILPFPPQHIPILNPIHLLLSAITVTLVEKFENQVSV